MRDEEVGSRFLLFEIAGREAVDRLVNGWRLRRMMHRDLVCAVME